MLPNALTAMTAGLPDLLAEYRYGTPEQFPRALGEAVEAAPLVVLLAGERWSALNGRLLSLGGDRLSVWEPPAEARVAFLHGGWSVAQLDQCMELAVGVGVASHGAPADANTHLEPKKGSVNDATYS